jgi:hypothetical protein
MSFGQVQVTLEDKLWGQARLSKITEFQPMETSVHLSIIVTQIFLVF